MYANPVGASLLANAECQSTSMLADTASSRAGSLPQGFGVSGELRISSAHSPQASAPAVLLHPVR
ncbi:hypothetical protein PkoCFBP13504_00730 [Pseudomonas koreensis]|nr:hypothetical protein PkoCFBP13504_00730 [Pseudomonas koreensis]